MGDSLFQCFAKGMLAVQGKDRDLATVPWNEHRDFKGVFLKNIVLAEHTKNLLTCHLVRIEPGCRIGKHVHPDSMELHEVVAGGGSCITESGEIAYTPGVVAVLPENSPHEVVAGEVGLCLFAKFVTVPK
ncbi:cupin domain-containing protein [Desulfovibrio sp. OttesenSCG-928-G15]|nr:cupin domain-containing protein [Desulfovibrio sp. OttesenSCG-928-G15]